MAVYAAHLTRTLQGTPSIFQVTAQEALGATVKPALQKLVEFLAAEYPDKCGWCKPWYHELYLLFDCCLQHYYLKNYAASFSESFYGLLRVPTKLSSEFNTGQHLPIYLERASLAALVLLPYIKDKIEAIVERWREDGEDGRLGKSRSDRVRRAAVHTYSVMYTAAWCARMVQLARYVAGSTHSYEPTLALLGLALRDAPLRQHHHHSLPDLIRNLFTGQFGSAAVTFPMLGGLVMSAVEYGAFVVQFLRWWDSSGVHSATLPTPRPPPREERAVRWKNKCPLCLQTWKVPTVLPVSGYIFCYLCISRHVRTHYTCPVTKCPVRETELVRLYLD